MVDESTSDKRRQAETIFAEAQQAYANGRLAWAVEYAREALRVDGSYTEARHWLAERYLEAGATDRASRQYQIILRADRDDQKAWAALEAIDPEGAARVRRLHEIPPDPFVRRRRAHATAEFDALEGGAGAQIVDEEAVSFLREPSPEDFIPLDEVISSQEMPEVGGIFPEHRARSSEVFESFDALGDEEVAAADKAAIWEFDEDREYCQQWQRIEGVEAVAAAIEGVWATEVMQQVVAACKLAGDDHPQLVAAGTRAAQNLAADPPQLYLIAEEHMQPLIVQGRPAVLAVPEGVSQVLSPTELTFIVGRCLGPILSGYLSLLQAVDVLLQRPVNSVRQLRLNWREAMAKVTAGTGPERESPAWQHLRAVGHAWQQRVELSADRAGLLACGDIEASCDAIARGTAASVAEAADRTAERLMARYEGHNAVQLAAISVDEDPTISAEYAVYRIEMLRWWAKSDGYQAAISQLSAQ